MPNDEITYTITYDANSDSDTNVVITDYLPYEVYPDNPLDPNYNYEKHTYTWNIGTLEPNESGFVTLTVVVNELAEPLGTITNHCEIEGDEYRGFATVDTNVCCWDGDIIYVDENAPGLNSGLSWQHAYLDLQDALERAEAGCGSQIWVAKGTYKPTDIPSDTSASFEMVNGIPIYGGFPSGGGQRNWIENETILDGYLGGYLDSAKYADYVVLAQDVNEATVLNGFTIKNGGSHGIYCSNSNLNIINCKVGPDNSKGIYCSNNSDPNIINCNIEHNNDNGIECSSSNPNIINCNIENNSLIALFCSLSNPNIFNCVIVENAKVWNYQGGIYCNQSSPTITNCMIAKNGYSTSYGGGVCCKNGSSPTITNCTFRYNRGDFAAGGIYGDSSSSPTVTNCILWGNYGDQISGDVNVTYSDVQGGYSGYNGKGNIDADPCFYNPSDPYSYHLMPNSHCIDAGSNSAVPLDFIDLDGDGNTTEQIPWDLDCQGRRIDGNDDNEPVVDMGADEYYWDPPDFKPDGIVNFIDYAIFANAWQTNNADISLDDDIDVDYNDLYLFCEEWLSMADWYQPLGESMMMGGGMEQGLGFIEESYLSAQAEQQQAEITQLDIEELLKWLEELWLDPEAQKAIDEDSWLSFIESLKDSE